MSHSLLQLARNHAATPQHGIYSVCSAHPWVLEAAMRRHLAATGPLLIEATCNQVNQFGGYTGMTPGRFRESVYTIARKTGFPVDRILLGGDHLGPFPWQHLPAEQAMNHACEMVRLFVREGYSKIHLDASLPCAGDTDPLPEHQIAERAAQLCAAAESAAAKTPPVYIIGTEVPRPGGALDEMELAVTSPEAAEATLSLHRSAFAAVCLDAAWSRVIALVVQPGVEFSHDSVLDYQPSKASQLTAHLGLHPGLVYEAHSTDYQRPEALAALVRDGFAILKVGPGLTYAMRQVLFALAAIEKELLPTEQQSQLPQWIEDAMLRHPEQWQKHYSGTPKEQQLLRTHSYSDRIRYYWNTPSVQQSVGTLLRNLQQRSIPETLLSDYLPVQYRKVRSGSLQSAPLPLLLDAVGEALDPYVFATQA